MALETANRADVEDGGEARQSGIFGASVLWLKLECW